jgi:hypothetical protein
VLHPRVDDHRADPTLEAVLKRIVVGLVVLLAALVAIRSWDPFGTEEVDRSQPVLVRSIEDLGELRTARANLQVVVDLEDESALPDFLLGERTLFVAAGTVDVAVDLRRVRVSTDGDTATITVPPPATTPPRLDLRRSRVYDRDRGVLDRIGDVFGSGTDSQRVYEAAEQKLAEAAAQDDALARTARENTQRVLAGLARGLGWERVVVRFDEAAAPPS